MAEEVGFEPTVRFHARRFSRPVQSTTLPLLLCQVRVRGCERFWKRKPRCGNPPNGLNSAFTKRHGGLLSLKQGRGRSDPCGWSRWRSAAGPADQWRDRTTEPEDRAA